MPKIYIPFNCLQIISGFLIMTGMLCISHVGYCQDSTRTTLQSPGHYLQVGEAKIYYEEAGTGETVVLIHDGLMNSNTWDFEWNALSKKFHVIRYDRRGYGLSDLPAKPFAQWEDLHTRLVHLKIHRVTLVGCSSGGGVAIDFALVHPEMMQRLILLGSVLHGMVVTSSFLERGSKNNGPAEKGNVKTAAENWSNDPFTILPEHAAARKVLYNTLLKYPHNLTHSNDFDTRLPVPAVRRLSQV